MKRVFEHPAETLTGKRYWRSLGELSDTPEFRGWLEREFPAGAAQLEGDDWSRRGFLKLMGASMALAGFGLTSCRRPEAHLVPFTKSVEWAIPGKALYYATAMPRRTGAIPLNYEEKNVLETLNEMTGGRGPDKCIDAVGMEAQGHGLLYAYDRAKQAMMLETDRPIALREAIID